MVDLSVLREKFRQQFQKEAEGIFFSPGRVNLIGEHTDNFGGHVFPCSITQGTYGLISPRNDQKVRGYSMNLEDKGILEFDLGDLDFRQEDDWTNYVKGFLKELKDHGYGDQIKHGFDLLVYGNIPNGAGLSSSASLELLVGVIAQDLYQLDVDRLDLVKMGQRVENHYIGVNSGIMDQFAVAFGAKDKAIFLNVNTLDYELVPADFGDYVILIMNTNKRRELIDSNYNQRRQECEEALRRLKKELYIQHLCDLNEDEFEDNRHLINDEVLERRAKHPIYENRRTVYAIDLLKKGDLKAFGQLLNASHISLRDDYEVTGPELDALVEAGWQVDGVLGARMTGAGMGGCAIALIHKQAVDEAQTFIADQYKDKIGYLPSFYVAEIGDGAKKIG